MAISEIVTVQLRQNLAKEFPECSKFASGNIGQGHLSGKQKYARIFVLYLALLKTEVFDKFRNKKGKLPKSKKAKKKEEPIAEASTAISDAKNSEEFYESPTGRDGADSDADDEDEYVNDISVENEIIQDTIKRLNRRSTKQLITHWLD